MIGARIRETEVSDSSDMGSKRLPENGDTSSDEKRAKEFTRRHLHMIALGMVDAYRSFFKQHFRHIDMTYRNFGRQVLREDACDIL